MNFSELFKQTNQLSRFSPNGKYLVSSRERTSFDLDFRYMKIHIFALRWKDEIRRSSQLRTPLKRVVVNRTWKISGPYGIFSIFRSRCTNKIFFRYQGSCVQCRLLVRDVKTLQILQLYTCLDVVQHVEVKFEFIRAEARSM